jgi:membrane protease YdiL (CAAX protease family)
MFLFGPLLLQGYFLLSSRSLLAGGVLPNQAQVLAFYDTLPGYLFAAAITGLWTGMVALVAGTLSPLASKARLGLGSSRLGRAGWLVVPLGALALNQAIDAAFTVSGFGRGDALEAVLTTLAGARGPSIAVAVLIVGALSATCEELFFRGYLQRRLVARFGPAVGIVVAAVLFGIAHWDWHHSLFACAFGLFVGTAAWAADSVWPAIVAHVVNNTVSVLTLVLGLDLGTTKGSWIALVSGTVVAVLAVVWIVRRAPRPRKLEPAFA